jgi:archaellum component FlaC
MVACMAVMARERWTDEQLDKAFGRVDGDLRELRVEMRKGFEQIDQRFEQMDRRFDEVDKRFEQMDKRFEQMDKRFEQVDKRFEQFDKRFERLFTLFASLCCTMVGSLIAGLVAALTFG